ncbi:hypothetical protein SAMN05421594_1629 [Chryseobacterium oleae]|uniref:Uncharacterized protein n=1 Tax=Chryseobacterium oleae TaxID=491207 RepID=A0A1I4XAF7_CHROL|nr:hypothetical protein SAMN05421594_1629 [Chryseobacterium oleae]
MPDIVLFNRVKVQNLDMVKGYKLSLICLKNS